MLIYDASASPGGALTSAHALAEVALGRGHQVVLVLVAPRCYEESTRWVRGLDARGHVQLELLQVRDFSRIRGLNWATREAKRASELELILSRHEPHVAIANNTPQANAALYFARGSERIFQYIRGPFYSSKLASMLLEQAERIFCVGDVATASAVLSVRDASRVSQITEGLSASQWPSPIEHDATRWMWAATLMRWKGLELMLEAYEQLDPEARPPLDVCYIPVSESEGAGSIPSHLPRGVMLHESPDIDRVRRAANVFIHTALAPEPFGRVILESMAAGLCVVVPDEGGAGEQVTHGVSGLRYKARSVNSLTQTLRALVERPAQIAQMGRRASKLASGRSASVAFAELLDACTDRGSRCVAPGKTEHVTA